jgi:hypothetical protein
MPRFAKAGALRRRAFIGALSGMAATIALPELASAHRRRPPPSVPPTTDGTSMRAVFTPNVSYVTTPLPANAPIDPHSADYLADFLNKLQTNPYMPAFGVEQLPSAMHIVPSGAPTRRILSGGWDNTTHSIVTGSHPDLDAQMTAVPVPDSFYAAHDGALEDDGAGGKTIGDCVYSIYQPSTDTIWEFWGAAKNGTTFDSTGRLVDQWVIMYGGRMDKVSQNPGYFIPGYYGANAAGLPTAAGCMTIAELQAGSIDHILGFEMPSPGSTVRYPAQRSDGPDPAPYAVPEGMVFRFPSDINFDTYVNPVTGVKLDRYGLMVAKAVQRYGMICWDQSGIFQFRCEGTGRPSTYTPATDPYWMKGGILLCPVDVDHTIDDPNALLCDATQHFGNWSDPQIPWDKLVVVAESYFLGHWPPR